MATQLKVIDTLLVCSNCLMVAVNGDDSGRSEGDPEPWSLIPESGQNEWIMGAEDCVCGSDDECTCADQGFMSCACDACGDLPGDRYSFVRLG